jgi:RND family efflux transporter MFP subunit
MRDLKEELASLRIERDVPRKTPWRPIVILLLFMVLGAAGFYFFKQHPDLANFNALEVQTVQASVQTTSGPNAGTPILTASGYLVARRQSVVSAKIQGRIATLLVDAGSVVQEGQVLATLDNGDYVANIAKSKADIEYAKANLAETQRQFRLQADMWRDKVVSQDSYDAAKSKVQLAQASLEQDQANLKVQEALLDFTIIRAPFSGIVVKKMTEVGESVTPIAPGVNLSTSSGAIVAMADMNSLEAEVDVNESNVGELKAGQPAEIKVDAVPNKTYKGYLRQVIPTADRTKATVTVKTVITNKDEYLKPEMSCNVTFLEPSRKTETKNAPPQRIVTIPKEAVTTRDGKSVVFQVENNKVHSLPVVTGADLHGQVIVKDGLVGSETLVSDPPQKLRDGDSVRVKG